MNLYPQTYQVCTLPIKLCQNVVNSTGFEPVPKDSKSSMLPLHHKLICKLNRTRTHIPRVVFWSVIQLHHKLNLCTTLDYSSISIVLRNREYLVFRTKTEHGLNQRPLLFGLLVLLLPTHHLARLLKMSTRHFLNATSCTGREIRTLKILFLRQERMPIPPFLHS